MQMYLGNHVMFVEIMSISYDWMGINSPKSLQKHPSVTLSSISILIPFTACTFLHHSCCCRLDYLHLLESCGYQCWTCPLCFMPFASQPASCLPIKRQQQCMPWALLLPDTSVLAKRGNRIALPKQEFKQHISFHLAKVQNCWIPFWYVTGCCSMCRLDTCDNITVQEWVTIESQVGTILAYLEDHFTCR